MGSEPGDADGGGTRPSGVRVSRRLAAAGIAAAAAALLAIAVLATRLASLPGTPDTTATASPSPTASASLTVSGIYQRVAPSVVTIRTARGLGSGVIVASSGIILTANHVIAGAGKITVIFADRTVTTATVSAADSKTDIAKLIPATLPQVVVPATLSGGADVGAAVVAIGNPLGLTDSVSSGVISGLNRTADTDTGKRSGLIQFDASVNPGSSGGPLLDARGMVIGIVVAIADPSGKDAFAGIGFAVPIGSAVGGGNGNGPNGPQI
jgi:putative serine protease PepD